MSAEPDTSQFPPGTRPFRYVIDVEFPGRIVRHREGGLWLSPDYDYDGVRAHVASQLKDPRGLGAEGTVNRFELTEEPS
jgi:hypothetical protein